MQNSHQEQPVPALTDPAIHPRDEIIADALGPAEAAWLGLIDTLAGPEFQLAPEWRYYNDGSMWLAKLLRGKKNLAWLSVWVGFGRMTFYFAERHRELLLDLEISDALHQQIATQPMVGRMLPVLMEIRTMADVEMAIEVLRVKMTAK